MSTIELGLVCAKRERGLDGTGAGIEYFNAGEKEIKYLTFTCVPYNAVKDVVACTISRKIEARLQLTGPIPPKHHGYLNWENIWFNPTINNVRITQIYIQYMDNTEEVIDGKDVMSMKDQNSAYYKEVVVLEQKAKAERERIAAAVKKLPDNADHQVVTDWISYVALEFKDKEESLLEVFRRINSSGSDRIVSGYLVGDYIEKEYSSNEELMKVAVSMWKTSISSQTTYYLTKQALQCAGYPEKYAEKIKKYDPTYVMPKGTLASKLSNKIGSLFGKK